MRNEVHGNTGSVKNHCLDHVFETDGFENQTYSNQTLALVVSRIPQCAECARIVADKPTSTTPTTMVYSTMIFEGLMRLGGHRYGSQRGGASRLTVCDGDLDGVCDTSNA